MTSNDLKSNAEIELRLNTIDKAIKQLFLEMDYIYDLVKKLQERARVIEVLK